MKRYTPEHYNCPCEAVMEEDPEGEWVKYEDVLLLIETNEAMYKLIMSERLIKE